ncbi:MAG TPA: MarP family serine protease [Pseudonocardiaceae bacterium]|nr:MarP family serine protease [Pseudonocardiaceae bacterium]
MNWVDLVVVLAAVCAAVAGARQGAVVAVPAVLCMLIGLVVGEKLIPVLVHNFTSPVTKFVFTAIILILLIVLGEALGVWLGRSIKRRIRNPRLAGVDNVLGSIVQGLVVFVVAWMVAVPLTVFNGLPGLESAISGSRVLSAVNSVMPASVQALPIGLRNLFNVPGLPVVLNPFTQTPANDVSPPNTALQTSAIVQEVRPSIVKIKSQAPQCSRALEGSGFVIAPHRVLTNAHVVAGTDQVNVVVGPGELDARVVYYDYDTDIAVLDVPDLTAPPLQFDQNPAPQGQDAIVLGYPLDGPYTASAARIRDEINLPGPNIYDDQTVHRDVYEIYAQVRSGNSGGPLIEPNGNVIGVVFGAAVDDSETGFALTARQVEEKLPDVSSLTVPVSTDQCAS